MNRPHDYVTFEYEFHTHTSKLSTYSKIVQSEHIYWIGHSDWMFYKYEYKSSNRKFHDQKDNAIVR
jgi:hypothetical protein